MSALQGDELFRHAGGFLQGDVLVSKALFRPFGFPDFPRCGDEDGRRFKEGEDQHGNLRHILIYERKKQEAF